MHDIFSWEPDPLENMLRPPSSPESETLRQAVYMRTRGVLRRRRFVRQFAYAAALLVSFGAGLLVMWMTSSARSASKETPSRVRSASKETPSMEKAPCLRCGLVKESALAKEWNAFDSDDHRGELYRQAGDSYMEDEYDPQSALRCYTNALDHSTKQDLAISAGDNWLLMAIKDARQKENSYAKTGS